MLASLLGEIVELLVRTVFSTVLGVLGLEDFAEIVAAVFGLCCIVGGAMVWWFGQ